MISRAQSGGTPAEVPLADHLGRVARIAQEHCDGDFMWTQADIARKQDTEAVSRVKSHAFWVVPGHQQEVLQRHLSNLCPYTCNRSRQRSHLK